MKCIFPNVIKACKWHYFYVMSEGWKISLVQLKIKLYCFEASGMEIVKGLNNATEMAVHWRDLSQAQHCSSLPAAWHQGAPGPPAHSSRSPLGFPALVTTITPGDRGGICGGKARQSSSQPTLKPAWKHVRTLSPWTQLSLPRLCGKLQGCINPSPALLSPAHGRMGVQPPAQNTHSPPRDKHAVCTPGMQWREPQQCTKFNVRIVLWQWSTKLAPDDCAGCNRVNQTEKAATAILSASQQKIQMERKSKRPKFGTWSWLQYRKQLLDFNRASHPTYYTEFYSNYEQNVVLLTPFFHFFKECLKFSHRLYTQWLH